MKTKLTAIFFVSLNLLIQPIAYGQVIDLGTIYIEEKLISATGVKANEAEVIDGVSVFCRNNDEEPGLSESYTTTLAYDVAAETLILDYGSEDPLTFTSSRSVYVSSKGIDGLVFFKGAFSDNWSDNPEPNFTSEGSELIEVKYAEVLDGAEFKARLTENRTTIYNPTGRREDCELIYSLIGSRGVPPAETDEVEREINVIRIITNWLRQKILNNTSVNTKKNRLRYIKKSAEIGVRG